MKSFNWYLLIVISVFVMDIKAQSPETQEDVISDMPNDTAKVNAIHETAYKRLKEENYTSKIELNNARQLAAELDYSLGKARNEELRGLVHMQLGGLDSAQYYFLNVLTVYEQLGKRNKIAEIYDKLGLIQIYKNDFDKGERLMQQALDICQKLKDHTLNGTVNNNMAALYIRRGWSYKDKKDSSREANLQFKGAIPYLEAAMAHFKAVNSVRGIATCNLNLGLVQMELGNYTPALNYMHQSKRMLEKNKEESALVDVYGYMGSAYDLNGKYDSALYWSDKSLKMAIQYDKKLQILESYKRKRGIYEKLKDYKNALKYHDLYDSINEYVRNEQKLKIIDELEIKYESEKQNLLLDSKQQVIDRQQLILVILAGVFLIVIVFFYWAWGNRTRMKRLNLMLAQRSGELKSKAFEVIQKNAALNDAIQRQNNLMAIVAHDLRAPLNNLTSLLRLMEENDSIEQQKLLKMAMKVTTDGLTLIEDIAGISELQVQGQPKYEEVELRDLVLETVAVHTPSALSKQIEILVNSPTKEAIHITTDRLMLVRILDNLISNAIKFSQAGKKIFISYQFDVSDVVIKVQDQGPGMSETDLQMAFQRFKKLTARPTAGESSNGLGLFIVKSLVKELSGEVDIESHLGEGTTFIITIPVKGE